MKLSDTISLAAMILVLGLMIHAAWSGPLRSVAREFRPDPAYASYTEAVAQIQANQLDHPRQTPPRMTTLAVATRR